MAAPRVLFVCRRNAGRSQIAAAFTARYGQGRVIVASAGTAPADTVDPTVAVAMREIGIDIRQNLPRRIEEADVRTTDICITMGCGDRVSGLPQRPLSSIGPSTIPPAVTWPTCARSETASNGTS